MCARTYMRIQLRRVAGKLASSYSIDWKHLKSCWTTEISLSWGHFSRFIKGVQMTFPLCSHTPTSAIRHNRALSSKRKGQCTCSYNHAAFEGMKMHIDGAEPRAITGLIFLPDKQFASLWAFSWHLTTALSIESLLLMQKMKWLRGLLNISELFHHNLPPL